MTHLEIGDPAIPFHGAVSSSTNASQVAPSGTNLLAIIIVLVIVTGVTIITIKANQDKTPIRPNRVNDEQ